MKTKDAPNVRQRILETAARLFYQQGYSLTGINQLIAEAGVAKASLYQQFRTKDEILLAYLQQASTEMFEQLEAAMAAAATPKAKVLAVFGSLNESMPAANFRGCNFQNALMQLPPEEAVVRAFIQGHKQKLSQLFARLIDDPALAEEITLLFEGALISCQIQQSPASVEAAGRMLGRLL